MFINSFLEKCLSFYCAATAAHLEMSPDNKADLPQRWLLSKDFLFPPSVDPCLISNDGGVLHLITAA